MAFVFHTWPFLEHRSPGLLHWCAPPPAHVTAVGVNFNHIHRVTYMFPCPYEWHGHIDSWKLTKYQQNLSKWTNLWIRTHRTEAIISSSSSLFPRPCLFVPLCPLSPPLPPLLSPVSPLVCVLVLAAAAVSPEVKQSAVIYQRVIGPIWEPRKPGPGLWRRSPELIKFQSSAMMNVKKLHPRYWRCGLGKAER